MKKLSFGISPCPNDTISFYTLLQGKVGDTLHFEPQIADVETLNKLALQGKLDVTKVSFGVLPYILKDYVVLNSGSALGRGCGPIVVGKQKASHDAICKAKIAVPGIYTTACLLLRLWLKKILELMPMEFSKIPEAVAAGDVDFGVIIHETRFTFARFGLVACQDLGQWWEKTTDLPIPLGCIVAKKSLGTGLLQQISNVFNISVLYGLNHMDEAMTFIKRYAQEMEEDVIRKHIELYVTDETVMLSQTGKQAINRLMSEASKLHGLSDLSNHSIFID